MTGLGHFSDLGPLVLGNLIHFALLGCLVGVLGPSSEQKVLGLVLKPLVQVGQLVARAAVLHRGTLLSLVSLLVDNEALVGDDGTNLILFLLSTHEEDLVVDLD